MLHPLITAAAVLAFGSFACIGQALAVTPLPLKATTPLVIPAQDEENEEVWQDLRPDIAPPEAAVGKREEAPRDSAAEPPMEEGSGDVENQELWRDLETGVTPPPGE